MTVNSTTDSEIILMRGQKEDILRLEVAKREFIRVKKMS